MCYSFLELLSYYLNKGFIMKKNIEETINSYISKDYKPWHMPGHKRKKVFGSYLDELFLYDFTEVPGLDDYHHPENGMITRSQLEASVQYKTFLTRYLFNGSTSGILAALYASASYIKDKYPDKKYTALVARNCHTSVYNTLSLLQIDPIYIYPSKDEDTGIYKGVTKEDFTRALDEAKKSDFIPLFAILTSPTYEGVFSDIKNISKLCYDIPLIVDEAHGAHLPFLSEKKLRENSAIYSLSDVVIQSLHKTLPSLTQTAIIHIPKESKIKEELKPYLIRYLSVFQSTSPSYIFMQVIEKCIAWCCDNRDKFISYYDLIDDFRFNMSLNNFKNFHLFTPDEDFDRSRLVIISDDMSINGEMIAKTLSQEFNIVVEMSADRYVTLVSSVMDSADDLHYLYESLIKLDDLLSREKTDVKKIPGSDLLLSTVDGAFYLKDCIGKTVDRYIYVYPPGIPIVAPGEEITKKHFDEITEMLMIGKKIYQN